MFITVRALTEVLFLCWEKLKCLGMAFPWLFRALSRSTVIFVIIIMLSKYCVGPIDEEKEGKYVLKYTHTERCGGTNEVG